VGAAEGEDLRPQRRAPRGHQGRRLDLRRSERLRHPEGARGGGVRARPRAAQGPGGSAAPHLAGEPAVRLDPAQDGRGAGGPRRGAPHRRDRAGEGAEALLSAARAGGAPARLRRRRGRARGPRAGARSLLARQRGIASRAARRARSGGAGAGRPRSRRAGGGDRDALDRYRHPARRGAGARQGGLALARLGRIRGGGRRRDRRDPGAIRCGGATAPSRISSSRDRPSRASSSPPRSIAAPSP